MASGVNFGQQQYFGFDPRTIPGCVLWLDALDSTTLYSDTGGTTLATPGGAVARWNDKSGSSNYVSQSTAGNRPTLSNIPSSNAYPSLYFPGTSTNLTSISNNPQSGNLSRTVFFIQHVPNTSSRFMTGTGSHSGGTPPTAFGMDNLPGNPILWAPYVYTAADNTFAVQLTGTRCVYAYYDSALSQIGGGYDFSVSNTKSTTLNTTATPWYFGNRPDGGGATTSYLCEMLLYNSALTTDQRQQVEGYLAAKWGLRATLPTAHPYKSIGPTMRLFQPVDVSGGALIWLDAADTRTITGSPVTRWADKSGKGYDATTGDGSVVAGTAINSRNTLRFGLNTRLYLSNVVMPSTQTSMFCVFKAATSNTSGGGTGYFIFSRFADNFSTFSGNEQFFAYQNPGAGRSYLAIIASPGERNWGNLSTTAFSTGVNVISMTGASYASSNGLSLPLVGTPAVSNTVTAASTYQICTSRGCCSDVFQYDLGELIVCDGTTPIPVAQQLEGYLAWKWGAQGSLPTTHPYSKVLPSTPLFTPTALAGCALWLDAADTTTLTLSGSSVTQWRDKSGNANHATGTVAPTYDATTRNVLFNGSSQYCTLPNGAYPFGNTPYSIFVVAYTRNAANPQWVLAGGTTTTNQAIGLLFYTTNAVWHSWWVNEYRVDNSIVNNTPAVINISYSTTRSIIINGGTASINTPGAVRANPNTPNYIGRRPDSAVEFFNGGMAECIIFTSELPTAQRQQVEGYLAWKWGLTTSLPTSHPYAKFRP
jgi:hypothetical protein